MYFKGYKAFKNIVYCNIKLSESNKEEKLV